MRVAAAIAAALAFAALPVIALGHAELVSSDPPAGGTLTTTPYTLTATFDEELTPDGSSIVVENSIGTAIASGTVSPDDAHMMTAELPAFAGLEPPGTFTVRWTATTADDGAVERGTYTFNVGAGSATPEPTPIVPGPATESPDTLIAIGLAAVLLVIVAFATIRTVRSRR
ncbi:MAG: copper resistance protein [Chloroflexota bacterium]|jgi:methionine-rich copper-binding protein CopC|nr:copper resistance protein [Chloroflexota bacterium]